jgi:hypothetical protein
MERVPRDTTPTSVSGRGEGRQHRVGAGDRLLQGRGVGRRQIHPEHPDHGRQVARVAGHRGDLVPIGEA